MGMDGVGVGSVCIVPFFFYNHLTKLLFAILLFVLRFGFWKERLEEMLVFSQSISTDPTWSHDGESVQMIIGQM